MAKEFFRKDPEMKKLYKTKEFKNMFDLMEDINDNEIGETLSEMIKDCINRKEENTKSSSKESFMKFANSIEFPKDFEEQLAKSIDFLEEGLAYYYYFINLDKTFAKEFINKPSVMIYKKEEFKKDKEKLKDNDEEKEVIMSSTYIFKMFLIILNATNEWDLNMEDMFNPKPNEQRFIEEYEHYNNIQLIDIQEGIVTSKDATLLDKMKYLFSLKRNNPNPEMKSVICNQLMINLMKFKLENYKKYPLNFQMNVQKYKVPIQKEITIRKKTSEEEELLKRLSE